MERKQENSTGRVGGQDVNLPGIVRAATRKADSHLSLGRH